MRRDFPYPEKAQHMINTISIKIFSHFFETPDPPLAAIFQHGRPVIGGKAPVLSVHGKSIRWCSGLSVHIEIERFHPCFHTVTTDSNRNISLKDNTMMTGIFTGRQQLTVQMELNIIIVGNVIIQWIGRFAEGINFFGLELGVLGPLVEIRSSVTVSQNTESRIRHQPVLILFVKLLECSRFQRTVSILPVQQLEIIRLVFHDGLIIHLRQCIQTYPFLLELQAQ